MQLLVFGPLRELLEKRTSLVIARALDLRKHDHEMLLNKGVEARRLGFDQSTPRLLQIQQGRRESLKLIKLVTGGTGLGLRAVGEFTQPGMTAFEHNQVHAVALEVRTHFLHRSM